MAIRRSTLPGVAEFSVGAGCVHGGGPFDSPGHIAWRSSGNHDACESRSAWPASATTIRLQLLDDPHGR